MFIPRLRAAMLLLALLVSNPTFGTTAAGADAATDSLLAADAELTRALVAGDVRALNAIYADDFVYVHSTGGVDTRKQFVDTIRTGRLRFKSITRVDSREPILSSNVRTYGDAGILSAVYDLVLIDPPGRPPSAPIRVRYLRVYITQQGKWRLVSQQGVRPPQAR